MLEIRVPAVLEQLSQKLMESAHYPVQNFQGERILLYCIVGQGVRDGRGADDLLITAAHPVSPKTRFLQNIGPVQY